MELSRALDPNNNVMTYIFTAQKAPPSQAEDVEDSQEANPRANVTSQEVALHVGEREHAYVLI